MSKTIINIQKSVFFLKTAFKFQQLFKDQRCLLGPTTQLKKSQVIQAKCSKYLRLQGNIYLFKTFTHPSTHAPVHTLMHTAQQPFLCLCMQIVKFAYPEVFSLQTQTCSQMKASIACCSLLLNRWLRRNHLSFCAACYAMLFLIPSTQTGCCFL